jgi:uncharacterized protein YbbC (DUF1343 family)
VPQDESPLGGPESQRLARRAFLRLIGAGGGLALALSGAKPAPAQSSIVTPPDRASPWNVRTGLEVFLRNPPDALRGRRVGLITNPTGVDSDLRWSGDLLAALPSLDLVALFGPEHGIHGTAQGKIAASADPRTGLPVHSLYGDTRRPTPDMLRDLDALIFDIQDVGVRYYTYISTLALALEAAAAQRIPFVVLDRPNPLGGEVVDGPILDPQWSSFIGMYPLPILHGMTVGELARLFNDAYGLGADLTVVPMEGWRREMWFDDTGLPWVITSPKIPHFDTAVLYPVLGPIGDTNLSVGVETTQPFEVVGAPFVHPWELRARLEARHLGGVQFRDAYWRGAPCAGREAPEYAGVEIRILDREAYRPVDLLLHILDVVHRLYAHEFQWGASFGGRYVFDLEMGTDHVRQALTEGVAPSEIRRTWTPDLASFLTLREKYLLYP